MASYAASFGAKDLTPDLISRAKEIVLDTIGAILLGSRPHYAGVRILADLAAGRSDAGGVTVFGRGFKSPFLDALLANGTMGYAADAEGAGASRMHAAAVFVPTVLTAGEFVHASGREAIAALCLAYDVACRVSDAADPGSPYPHSFHPSAVFGHFGAAAAAGHLLKLDETQFINALGLAGINATGLIAWVDDPSEDSRPFVIGVAAQSGARAALLARQGMGGPTRILDDAKYSIYDAFSTEMHAERLLAGLGKEYRILDAGGYKQYPCCADIHTGLDALLGIRARYQLAADQIEQITHRVKPARLKVIDNNLLKSHNSQYIMSVAAVYGRVGPEDILVDRRSDPEVAKLYERAVLAPDEGLTAVEDGSPAVVEVRLANGDSRRQRVDYAKGSRQNPFSRGELEDKFMRWATTAISERQARRIVELTDRLDELKDVGELTRLLAATRANGSKK
ncbi:MAG: MmgE/PrpD family protein [Chloroflexi bacterium]|nr:MmgE/PrpD family protein [Chloroflexota bacterium]